ncbi:MAG: hypothetical protein V1755_06525 [Chloroflexota bacterium]
MTEQLQSEIELANQLYQQVDGKSWDSYSGFLFHQKVAAIWPLLLAELELVKQLRAANPNLMAYERDHEAMNILRADDGYNAALDQVEDTEGKPFWSAEVGAWGIAEATDPAEAIMKAYKVNAEHKMLNPIKMEEK